MSMSQLVVITRPGSRILSTISREHMRSLKGTSGSLVLAKWDTNRYRCWGMRSDGLLTWNSQSRRFQSTSTYAFDYPERVIDGAAETLQTPLEFMAANSTLSSGAGTIFSDTGAVIWTSEILCALKDCLGTYEIKIYY